MTFSIAGRCPRTGGFGAVISSSSPAVASRCVHARAGVGVACTQNVTDPRLGPALLDAIGGGEGAVTAVATAAAAAGPAARWRQLTAVTIDGPPGAFSGAKALGVFGSVVGRDCVAAGNMLDSPQVLTAAAAAFDSAPDSTLLEERLLAALEAGAAAGGEAGPLHSAGLYVVADVPWPVTDLRVDWTEGDPVTELRALWQVWAPQRGDYRQRGLDPGAAPGYGVPGDPRPTAPTHHAEGTQP